MMVAELHGSEYITAHNINMDTQEHQHEEKKENEGGKPKLAHALHIIKTQKKNLMIVGGTLLVVVIGFCLKNALLVASVDGALISRMSVVKELEKQGGKQVLEGLITERLIQNEARKKGIVVSEEEITAEIGKIEAQVSSQGMTLADALSTRGMTLDVLKDQIQIQKEVEKLIAEKVIVSEEEVQSYITTNKITLPKGEEQKAKDQIKEQIKNQKMTQEVQIFIAGLKTAAKITYYREY
jgi:hypothetical protein